MAILQRSVRLYAPFYSSDILIGSPLGLRTIIGGEGEKKRDFDFLSSVELLIIDQADIYLMQNWEHVLVRLDFPFGGQHPCSVPVGWFKPKTAIAGTYLIKASLARALLRLRIARPSVWK